MASYKVELTVLSSVHIGAGAETDIIKCDYIKRPNEDKITIINEKELFAYLEGMKLGELYVDFVEGNRGDLYTFLTQNCRLNVSVCNNLINKVKKYEIDCYANNFRNIKAFIKDKITGKPYIPGSSIKGMLATAIQAYKEKNHRLETYTTWESYNSKPYNVKDELKEIMRTVSVSDSSLIDLDNLYVTDIRYAHPSKVIKSKIPQYYEMLYENTTVTFNLNLQDESVISINEIKEMLKDYCNAYEKYYANVFSFNNPTMEIVNADKDAIKCYLGAKTGFPTKSTYYQVNPITAPEEIISILDKAFKARKGKHFNEKGKSPACLKCVEFNTNEYLENGAIQLKFRKMENP